ncbi:MAG: SDR family oxidoreductase [Kiritimatiellae bacterium]|nr:SDR family oxidoreductase [Kiritimatiellia bacterium]
MAAGDRGSVLVTGGCRRIGAAIVARLRADGWNVLVHGRRDAPGVLGCDLREPGAAERLFARALAAAADLRAVVNNAAAFSVRASLPPAEAAALDAVNLAAPKRLTELLAALDDGRPKCVVNLADAAVLGREPRTPYERTKAALAAWTREAALAFAATTRVNAVAPGPALAPEGVHVAADETALARRPSPEDVADAVAYLLDASAVTGVVLPVDAGSHLIP